MTQRSLGINIFLWSEHGRDALEPFSPREKGRDEGPKPERARSGADSSGTNQLPHIQQTARDRQNDFAALMEAVKTHSLGQISHALYDVGGEYRRNM